MVWSRLPKDTCGRVTAAIQARPPNTTIRKNLRMAIPRGGIGGGSHHLALVVRRADLGFPPRLALIFAANLLTLGVTARCTALADQPRQHHDDAARAQPAVDLDRQPLLGPLVGDGQALELLAVCTPVEHEVVRPHLVGAGRRLPPRPARRDALARPPTRHLQAGPPPQSPGPASAHAVAAWRGVPNRTDKPP